MNIRFSSFRIIGRFAFLTASLFDSLMETNLGEEPNEEVVIWKSFYSGTWHVHYYEGAFDNPIPSHDRKSLKIVRSAEIVPAYLPSSIVHTLTRSHFFSDKEITNSELETLTQMLEAEDEETVYMALQIIANYGKQ